MRIGSVATIFEREPTQFFICLIFSFLLLWLIAQVFYVNNKHNSSSSMIAASERNRKHSQFTGKISITEISHERIRKTGVSGTRHRHTQTTTSHLINKTLEK